MRKQYLEELKRTVSYAGLAYEVWWEISNERNVSKYKKTMRKYRLHFMTASESCFVALLTDLYRLYETRKDTYNIPKYLDYLEEKDICTGSQVKVWREAFKTDIKPLWKKVSQLRNKVYGHQSMRENTREVFKNAAITPDDIKTLIKQSETLLNEIASVCDNSKHMFNYGSGRDTKKMLVDLDKQSG